MARPAPFPHHYRVQLASNQLSAPPRSPIDVGPPPQFGGTDQVWSPEELLVGAALECLWTTFAAYARHDGLEYAGWRGAGEGVLDKSPTGLVFTAITLTVEFAVAEADQERGRRILATAKQHCIVSNALRVEVGVEATVHVLGATAVAS